MESARSSSGGSGGSGTYTPEIAEALRFEEEIQSLMRDGSPPASGSSFTALLGLSASQAVELLHDPGEIYRRGPSGLPLGCSPTFPSNDELVERAARFSVFAAAGATESPQASISGGPAALPKPEPADCDSGERPQWSAKRKESDRSKSKQAGKKSRSGDEGKEKREPAQDGGKLPYVHVRVRRGQATDSHSLAERARREKINARMKLLQELVPGCSKISGTAQVLDEIINHVQSLQRQVEFLSMRLAAVNPRIDFSGLDSFLSAECGRVTAGNGMPLWIDAFGNGGRRQQQQQQIWHIDLVQPQEQQRQQQWERDQTQEQQHVFISNPGTSLFAYDPANSVSVQTNQLKTVTKDATGAYKLMSCK